ncbi:MAG: CRISPR-associated protein Cas2 [Spirochaetaceae bacterium]|nr:CRISPR-associated protein Cas2 [Spirochaetaceae bacterium]
MWSARIDKKALASYNFTIMFVSIAVDPGSEGRAKELAELLIQYGFDKVQRGLWESTVVSPETLGRIKRDLDRATDAFDRLRIFQFPVDGTLVLSTLRDKKWRRLVARGGEAPVQPVQAPPVRVPVRPVRMVRRGRQL